MKTIASLLLVLFALAAAEGSDDGPPLAERLRATTKDYNVVSREIRRSKTLEDRKAVARRFDTFAKKFLDLAEAHAKDPVAITAIRSAIQAILTTDSRAVNIADFHPGTVVVGSSDGSAQRAVGILLRDYPQSKRVGPICDRMRYSCRVEFEPFLVANTKNPHRAVRGLAHLALGQLLHNQLRLWDLASDREEMTRRYDTIYGDGFLERLQRLGRDQLVERIETAYVAATQYDDVLNIPLTTSVAEKAKRGLYELRQLSPGQPAPKIQGLDQYGRPLALADYRGKVVLLYFWQEH